MILSGKVVAEKIEAYLATEVEELKGRGVILSLAVILVGEDLASLTYVKAKEKVAERLGVNFRIFHFSGECSQKQILELLDELNADKDIHGIIIQLPLPGSFDVENLINSIDPAKDVDGLRDGTQPPTVLAIMELLKFYEIPLQGNIVLVGHGKLVGQPLEKMLGKMGVKVGVCDSSTADLAEKTRQADILISATGKPGLITPEMVSGQAVVIDAGTAESGGSVKGDVLPSVYEKVKAYSPVPGGVGPLTVMMLMRNLVEAAKKASR